MSNSKSANTTGSENAHHSSEGRNIISTDDTNDTSGHKDIFYAAVQMSRMPMVLTDPHIKDNPIVFCNRAFEALVGYSNEEIIGRNCRFLQGASTNMATVKEIRRALDAGEDVHEEVINYRKDGSYFWNALFISPVRDTDGHLVYHFASQLDVTRRREAEIAHQESQRMETLGSMASSVAHEFNNLMTIVMASLERLEKPISEEKHAVYVKRALWGTTRATRLTEQMLSFARRQITDNQVVDISSMIVNFDGILQHVGGAKAKVSIDVSAQNLYVNVDPGQLELSILNLMKNAVDAMEERGTIVVSVAERRAADTGGIAAVVVSVADSGSGMSEEVIRRATEPFFTTKALGKGTGLGLSMVSGFAEQSGGSLEIESHRGKGTTMRLVFPRAVMEDAAEAMARCPAANEAEKSAGNKKG